MSKWAKKHSIALCIAVGTAVLVLGVAALIVNGGDKGAERGDWIGGHLAAAGSIASTFFFLAALIMQRRDLQVQAEILKATIEEMRQSREVYEAQEAQLRRQVEIADKTGTVSRFLELRNLNETLMVEYTKARKISGSPEANREYFIRLERKWAPKLGGLQNLLRDLAGRGCIDESERKALLQLVTFLSS